MPIYINILYASCVFILVLVVGILLPHRSLKSHQAMILFCLSSAFWMASLYLGFFFSVPETIEIATLFFRIAFASAIWITFFLVLFVYFFPRKTWGCSKRCTLLFLTITSFISLVSVFTPYIYTVEEVLIEKQLVTDSFGSLYILFALYTFVNWGVALWIGGKKISVFRGIERKKSQFAFIGLLFFILAGITTNIILPVFEILIFQREAVIFSLLFVLPAFYSMHRHRFFNLSGVTLNMLRRIILLSTFLFMLYLVHQGIDIGFPDANHSLMGLISGSMALGLLIKLSKIFPHLTPSDLREFQNALLELRTKAYTCTTYEHLQSLLDQIFEIRLNISNAKIFMLRDKDENIAVPVYVRDAFIQELKKQGVTLVTEEIFLNKKISKKSKDTLLSGLQKIGATICCPLFAEDELIGIFILGHKEKRDSYTREEIDSILECIPSLEIAFMNILLQNNFKEERDMLKSIIREKTEKLEVIVGQQSDFMKFAAHELRTPLSIAIFQFQEILDVHKKDSEFNENAKTISTALEDLKNLTEKLFEAQQYELGKIDHHPEQINIGEFLVGMEKEVAPMMKEKSLHFSLQNTLKKDISVFCDAGQIRQVLHNLLVNAIKFTPQGGKIVLRASSHKKGVQICVQDDGEGISDTYKKSIFEKFQSKNPSLGMGMGLGLYICKKIIELNHGEIWVEDTPKGGTTFCCILSHKR